MGFLLGRGCCLLTTRLMSEDSGFNDYDPNRRHSRV